MTLYFVRKTNILRINFRVHLRILQSVQFLIRFDVFLQYLRSVRPLLDDSKYEKMKQMAKEFEDGIGVKLQRYLLLKSW